MPLRRSSLGISENDWWEAADCRPSSILIKWTAERGKLEALVKDEENKPGDVVSLEADLNTWKTKCEEVEADLASAKDESGDNLRKFQAEFNEWKTKFQGVETELKTVTDESNAKLRRAQVNLKLAQDKNEEDSPQVPTHLLRKGPVSWRVASASVQECEECGAVNGVSTPPGLPAHTSATNPQPPPEQSQGFRQLNLIERDLQYSQIVRNAARHLVFRKVVMQSEWWLEGAEGAEVEVVVKGIPDVKNFVANLCKGPQEIVEEGPRK
ncbi:hypothetical protein B0H13DRAFT_1867363 [Mycena leptocephala]|nr:hypothetical protein B0H13DRAFT_1867363 [Mycena leptocephala]